MSDNNKFRMSDDLIAVVRELVQLSLITGTNIVDHLRNVEIELEVPEADNSVTKLIPTVEYVEAYNAMVEQLVEKATETQKKLDEPVGEVESFVDSQFGNN